jgi:hypothetical protein
MWGKVLALGHPGMRFAPRAGDPFGETYAWLVDARRLRRRGGLLVRQYDCPRRPSGRTGEPVQHVAGRRDRADVD